MPDHRHKIRQAGNAVELVTHYGYVLGRFATMKAAQDYYALHCPTDSFVQQAVAEAKERQREQRAAMAARRA